DQHHRDLVPDGIAASALGAHDPISLLRDGRFAGRTGQNFQELFVDHVAAPLSVFNHSTVLQSPSSNDTRGRQPSTVSARWMARLIRCTSPGIAGPWTGFTVAPVMDRRRANRSLTLVSIPVAMLTGSGPRWPNARRFAWATSST